jgi:hypothetical protein
MSRLRDYHIAGPATRGAALGAGSIDAALGIVAAMLVFPFPLVRYLFGVQVLVIGTLVAIVVGWWAVRFVSLLVWGRTPGMYFLDLGLEGAARSAGPAAGWALGWTIAWLPGLLFRGLVDPDAGLPARMSGLPTRSTLDG